MRLIHTLLVLPPLLGVALSALPMDDVIDQWDPRFIARSGDGYVFGPVIAETKNEAVLSRDAQTDSQHQIKVEALLVSPPKLDTVCVEQEQTVVSARNAKKQSVLQSSRGRPKSDDTRVKFQAFQDGVAYTEIPKTELKEHPAKLDAMDIRCRTVVATAREEVMLKAIVQEREEDVGHGVSVRISSMKISRKLKCDIMLEYTRPAGFGAAFVEEIHAVGANGKDLGGGRWAGDAAVFAARGKHDFEFQLKDGQDIESLRLVLCTRYEAREQRFTVKHIWDQ